MGLLSNLNSLFKGLTQFFTFLREMFTCLPMVVQVLIYFSFGGVLLLCLLKMLHEV